jgi:hypothetical protein
MIMSRMTPLCGNLHRAVAAGRLWTEIAADLRRSRGRFPLRVTPDESAARRSIVAWACPIEPVADERDE